MIFLIIQGDPLVNYSISEIRSSFVLSDDQFLYSNSVLKFMSDLFSIEKSKNTTNIFYSNDFNVLLDIIIRKLSNLNSEDQVRIFV
jgi:hypothetical protein